MHFSSVLKNFINNMIYFCLLVQWKDPKSMNQLYRDVILIVNMNLMLIYEYLAV